MYIMLKKVKKTVKEKAKNRVEQFFTPLNITLASGEQIFLRNLRNEVSDEGILGAVYYAGYGQKDREGKPSYFIKAIPLSDARWEQIKHEQKILEKLAHPGIIDMYGPVEEAYEGWLAKLRTKREYFVFKHLEWATLKNVFKSEKPEQANLNKKLRVIRELAQAVDYLHTSDKKKGIIYHQNIGPDTIIIQNSKARENSSENLVKLVNFRNAIELPLHFSAKEKIESTHDAHKTTDYLAPERIPEKGRNKWLNAKSEIWALGIIAYQLLAKKHPFTKDRWFPSNSEKHKDLQEGKKNKDYVPLRNTKIADRMPSGLVDIVEASLEHNWRKRPNAKDYLTRVKW